MSKTSLWVLQTVIFDSCYSNDGTEIANETIRLKSRKCNCSNFNLPQTADEKIKKKIEPHFFHWKKSKYEKRDLKNMSSGRKVLRTV